jgi:nitroreductase
MNENKYSPLEYVRLTPEVIAARADENKTWMLRRRSVRDFSSDPVERSILEHCLITANSALSGANRQPWHFAVITDPTIKRQIREAAQEEERLFYKERASKEWLDAIAPMGVDANKQFLEAAPCLIVIFSESYLLNDRSDINKNYYVAESVGIATGFLIAALHNAVLATLTHTPSPMGFLSEILQRPKNEKPFLILVVGYPAKDIQVPELSKNNLNAVASWHWHSP